MEILQQMGSLPIIFIMCIVIYFLMIRPQSLKQKQHNKMLEELKKSDKVLTNGGLIGNIVDFKGKDKELILLDCGNNTKVTIKRSYITTIIN